MGQDTSKPRIGALLTIATSVLVSAAFLGGQASARDGDALAVGVQALPDSLEPMREWSNVGGRTIPSVAETLIAIDYANDHRLVPGLAESWQRIDGTTLEFVLREGVTCHNGEALTAEDVAFTFGPERFSGEDAPGRAIGSVFLSNIEPPEVIDAYRVRISSKVPDPLLEHRMANYMGEIICKDAYEAAGSWDEWSRAIVGTGPYQVSAFQPGDFIRLERFDGYWGETPPASSVTFREVPEVATRIAGLFSGEFDIVTNIPVDNHGQFEGRTDVEIVGGGINNILLLLYDTVGTPLADPRIRQAMNLAIDRELIVETLFQGRTEVPQGMQMREFGDMYLDDLPKPAYDPERARQLLEEAGYDGTPINYKMVSASYYPQELNVTRAIVDMWKEVGLNVDLMLVENWSQVTENVDNRMVVNGSATAVYPDPVSQLWRKYGPTDRTQKDDWWTNAQFNELGGLLQASTDLEERRETFRKMLGIAEQDPPGTVLHVFPSFYGKRADLDWTPYSVHFMDFGAGNLRLD